MASATEPLAVRIGDAATLLGVTRQHLYHLVARGELRTVTLGRARLVPMSELRRIVGEDK
jgi:excisionase family DNA binding protein